MAIRIKGIWVKVLEPGLLQVQSFSNPERWYVVDRFAKTCTCPDHKYRGRVCKHLRLIEELEWKVELEEGVWRANKEFEMQRSRQIQEKMRKFKPIDEKTRRAFQAAGWEYDEDLSALVWALITG